MTTNEITNLIYTHFLLKGYRPNIDISLETDEDEEEVFVQVQIDVELLNDPNLNISTTAFFYDLEDDMIFTSTIFFLNRDISDEELAELKELHGAEGVYDSVIKPDDGENEIHLYHEIPIEDFEEKYLDDVIAFFQDGGALLAKLKALAAKS